MAGPALQTDNDRQSPGHRPTWAIDGVQRETDAFGILSWVRKLNADATLMTSMRHLAICPAMRN